MKTVIILKIRDRWMEDRKRKNGIVLFKTQFDLSRYEFRFPGYRKMMIRKRYGQMEIKKDIDKEM